MATDLIGPDQLPTWVPGRLTVHNPVQGWDGVAVRGYVYAGSDVEVPAMRDYVVVAYLRGTTAMRRRVDGDWITETLGPGDVSLLTRAAQSHWVWPDGIEVVHVYLSQDELAATCREMSGREVCDVELYDEVRADDPALFRIAMSIAAEAGHPDSGSKLVVDALTCELAVHILRRHARVGFRDSAGEGLSFHQERVVREYIAEHLCETVSLEALAATVGLSRYRFGRQFRHSVGVTPHAFLLQQRIERAELLVRRTTLPLPDVAVRCGFSDQSHMTRVFRTRTGVTPGRLRTAR